MKKFIVLALFGLTPLAHGLNFSQTFTAAKNADLTYAQAQLESQAGEKIQTQANALLYPSISGSVSYSSVDANKNLPSVEGDSTRMSIDLRQPLYNKEAFARYVQAGLSVDMARLQARVAEESLAYRSVQVFINLLNAQENFALAQEELKVAKLQLDKVSAAKSLGSASAIEFLQAQASADLKQASLWQAQNDLDTAKSNFKLLMGVEPKDLGSWKRPFVAKPLRDDQAWSLETLQAQNLSLKQIDLARQSKSLEVDAQLAGHYPNVTLSASFYQVDTASVDYGATQWALALNVPLFSGFATSAKVEEAQLNKKAAQVSYNAAQNNLAQASETLKLTQTQLAQQILALDKVVKSSESSLEAIETGYSLGSQSLVDVIDARAALTQAKKSQQEAWGRWLLLQAEIQRTFGSLNLETLQAFDLYLM